MYDFYLILRELDVTWYVDLYGEFIKIGGGLIIIISSTYTLPHKIAYTQKMILGFPNLLIEISQTTNLLIEIFITLKNS